MNRMILVLAYLALALVLTGTPSPVRAAGTLYAVDSLGDNDTSGDGKCTLREAITAANNSASTDCGPASPDADAIKFSVSGTIALTSALPPITDNLSIDGGNAITLSGSDAYRILYLYAGHALTVNNLTLTHGFASGHGGAIANLGTLTIKHVRFLSNQVDGWNGGGALYTETELTVTDSEFAHNNAGTGGAIYARFHNTEITGSQFHDNHARLRGGGLYIVDGATATIHTSTFRRNKSDEDGGGIFNNATVTLSDVRLTNNSANSDGGGIHSSYAISLTRVTLNGNKARYGGGISHSRTANLTNVTLGGNSASDRGGGIRNYAGNAHLTNVTLSGNSAPDGMGGGILNEDDQDTRLYLKNVVVANSPSGGNCRLEILPESIEFSLSSDDSCPFGAGRSNVNILLGLLAYNGGFTKTFALKRGSPAINNGTGDGCPSTDQRGGTRPQQTTCDVGAFEHGALPPGMPRSLTATDLDNGQERLNWLWAHDAFRYVIVVKDKADNVVAQKRTRKTVATFTLGSGSFTWTVTAINDLGRATSKIGSFTR